MNMSITAVERDLGVSKDVLRVWERRYGFPRPERDANGDRSYPPDQVRRLRLIKRLMDQGHRPGRLLTAPTGELEAALAAAPGGDAAVALASADDPLQPLADSLRRHDESGFLQLMQRRLAEQGLRRFVQDTVAPMSIHVGLAWENGRLEVFEEHLFTELTARTLRQAIAALPPGTDPRVLLTTLPDEPHTLGLLMVETVLALAGARCICLGTQTPLNEIADAARAFQADIVALSFSAAFPRRQIAGLLAGLRGLLAPEIQLWTGGTGCSRLRPPEGVRAMSGLDDAAGAVAGWRGGVRDAGGPTAPR